MTDEQLGAMTLADIEALAKRLSQAVGVLRDAQGFLSGSNAPQAIVHAAPFVQHQPTSGPSDLSPVERAEREKLLRQFRHDGLPDEIKRAEAE